MEPAASPQTGPTQDERIMAALSHISILIPTFGMIVPVIIWITQKDKSRYVVYQALQALAFQLVRFVLFMFGMGCYMFSIFSMMFTIDSSSRAASGPPAMFIVPFGVLACIGFGALLFLVYAVFGTVMTLQGKDFEYIGIADLVARVMGPGGSR